MGKRKKRGNDDKAPPPRSGFDDAMDAFNYASLASLKDLTPQVPQEDLESELRSSDQAESSAAQSQAPIMGEVDTSLKRLPSHQSPLSQNHGSHRAILLRHSRHPFGRHYSRRSSSNHSDAFPSHWKGTPVYDPNLSFKFENRDLLNFPYRDNRNQIFQKPERIRASLLSEGASSRDVRKVECTICHKRLRKNSCMSENSISSTHLSVVAVLSCGHVYHANCLEQQTTHEDRRDPPCPQCASMNC